MAHSVATSRDATTPHSRTRVLAILGAVVAIAFAITLYGGYGPGDWTWTGYKGAELWDWLHVLLLPLTLSILAALEFDVRSVKTSHLVFITAFVVVITILAIGGYTAGWDWTGFEGNTLFDWLKLLFLPVVIPLVVIPVVRAAAVARHGVNHP